MTIVAFRGQYRFLSNFALVQIFWMDRWFKSVEHAYQASKWNHVPTHVSDIENAATPAEAKKLGGKKKITIKKPSGTEVYVVRDDWDQVKLPTMETLLRKKFQYSEYRKQLLETGDQDIIEGNTWGDTFWGICDGVGENHLGKLLMMIREEIRK